MLKPLVSIITVNLNDEKGLHRTFQSVFCQKFKNFEYIVIDGGSTDGSVELMHTHSEKISVSVSEPDSGLYAAMNKGIALSTGSYLIFLNSGDEFFDGNVLSSVFCVEHAESFLFGDMLLVHSGGRKTMDKGPGRSDLGLADMYFGTLNHPVTFIRREIFQKYGFYDVELNVVADWKLFFLAIGLNLEKTKYLDMPISIFYSGGLSSQKSLVSKEREIVMSEYLPNGVRADYDKKLRLIFNKNIESLVSLERAYSRLRRSKVLWFFQRVILRLAPKK